MALIVLGINHASAPAKLRERVAFSRDVVEEALRALVRENACITEAVILSTCNRTEVYAVAHTAPVGKEALMSFLCVAAEFNETQSASLAASTYFHHAKQCVRHLFRVVSSLDSLVLGEAQILGQVRNAYAHAGAAGTCGHVLTRLFRQALEVGKRVRTETAIGQLGVSVASVAADMALQALHADGPRADDDPHVLVVGTGQMAELAATYLLERGVEHIDVANRTIESARQLAERTGGEAFTLAQLDRALAASAVVISATSAPQCVIDAPLIRRARSRAQARSRVSTGVCEQAGEQRQASTGEPGSAPTSPSTADAPLLIIDIALPRDVDPRCAEITGVTCKDIDDLAEVIDRNKLERRHAASDAERIVEEETDRFLAWMQEQTLTPTIKELYGKSDGICQREVAHAARELARAQGAPTTPEQHAVLEALARAVEKKILHGPVTRMRKQATNPDGYLYTDAARFLFGLDTNPQGLPCVGNPAKCHIDTHGSCRFAEIGSCPFGRETRSS